MDYNLWKYEIVSVTDLRLDQQNHRLTTTQEKLGQIELLHLLVEKEKVLEIATSIADNGFYPSSAPIVINNNDSSYTVFEGNRRVAALKLLFEPSLAPTSSESKFRKLAEEVGTSFLEDFSAINVCIVPSRESAVNAVYDTHGRHKVKGWNSVNQAAFFDRYSDIIKFDERAKRLNLINNIQRLCYAIDLPDAYREKIQKGNITSTLEYIFTFNKGQQFLGIEIDGSGNIIGRINKDEFLKALKKIIIDACSTGEDKINTRVLENADKMATYFATFGSETPDKTKPGVFDVNSICNPTPSKPKKIPTKTPTSPATPNGLFYLKDVPLGIDSSKVKQIRKELHQVNVKSNPISSAVMLRVFIEISMKAFLKKHDVIDDVQAKYPGQPSFGEMIDYLLKKDCQLLPDKDLKEALKSFKNFTGRVTTDIKTINSFIHNEKTIPTEDKVRMDWDFFAPFIKHFLNEEQ